MATGDVNDIKARINSVLPPWFGDSNPILNAVLAMAAAVLSFIYGLYAYAKAQTRVKTATGIWLDIIAQDFFGTLIRRGPSEQDEAFRARILALIFRPKATRAAISQAVQSATGFAPVIIEPFNPSDCGAYGVGYACYGGAGAYGSISLPAQAFIIAYRPPITGIANVAGYGNAPAGYSVGSQSEYASMSMTGGISDANIYSVIDDAKAAGVTLWGRLAPHKNYAPLLMDGTGLTMNGNAISL